MAKKHNKLATEEVVAPKYYKTKDGKGWLGFRPDVSDEELEANYVEVTEQEWNEHLASLHHEPTPEQIAKREKKRQIAQLKSELASTDYVVVKIAESDDPDEIAALREEYATVIAHRKELRAQINELEGELE